MERVDLDDGGRRGRGRRGGPSPRRGSAHPNDDAGRGQSQDEGRHRNARDRAFHELAPEALGEDATGPASTFVLARGYATITHWPPTSRYRKLSWFLTVTCSPPASAPVATKLTSAVAATRCPVGSTRNVTERLAFVTLRDASSTRGSPIVSESASAWAFAFTPGANGAQTLAGTPFAQVSGSTNAWS